MREQPDAASLIDAVTAFLRDEVMPQLDGRTAFHVRVAANALDIAKREVGTGGQAKAEELARLQALLKRNDADAEKLSEELSTRIRDGSIEWDDPALIEHLWETTLDTLSIDQPRYATYRAIAKNESETGE